MKLNEITLYIFCLVWFMFTISNVNPSLGTVYLGFTVGAMLLYLFDTKKTIEFDRDGKWANALMISGGVYVVFTIITYYLSSFLQKVNIGGLISLLLAATPALATSKIISFITFALPVAFIETQFWARLVDFFATRFRIQTNKQGLFTLLGITLISVLSFAFLMFHVTAYGITNNTALMIAFVMMFVSLGMVFIYQESKQAVLFHIIANTAASLVIFYGITF